VGARLHLGRLRTFERELHLGLLGMLLGCEQRQNCQGFLPKQKILVQQVQLPCARSNPGSRSQTQQLHHHMESWTRRILLLRVSVDPQFHFTHQQLSQHTALHSRLPRIETKAALRDHGKCKLSCVVPLYVLPSSNNTCVLFLEKSWPDLITVISSQSNREAGYNLCKMQYLILASMWSEFTIWQEVFLQSLELTQRNCGRSSLGILRNVGIIDQRR
jgi:hypothetical protein